MELLKPLDVASVHLFPLNHLRWIKRNGFLRGCVWHVLRGRGCIMKHTQAWPLVNKGPSAVLRQELLIQELWHLILLISYCMYKNRVIFSFAILHELVPDSWRTKALLASRSHKHLGNNFFLEIHAFLIISSISRILDDRALIKVSLVRFFIMCLFRKLLVSPQIWLHELILEGYWLVHCLLR